MKSKRWVGVLLGAAFACVARPSLAEDKGKTAAAGAREPVAGSPAAAVRESAAGQAAGAGRARDSRLPQGHEGRARNRRSVRRGRTPAEGHGGRLLQDHRGLGRPAGRGPAIRLRDVLHEREGPRSARQRAGVRGRRRTEPRHGGRGHGEDHHDQHPQGRHLRLRLRPEGADGGARPSGQQDNEDRPSRQRGDRALFGATRRARSGPTPR